jgi:hypothetical protein
MTEEQFQACRAWVRDIDQRRTALRSKMADLRAAVDEYARLDAQLQGLAPEAGRTAFFEAKYALSQELLRRELTRAD